ncbi:hypothetical protein K461DRAFT_319721 [Myriangium duriaei CBS 260.36]|uniref:Cryptic loci regulator 2 N-terminal domain-containing protein n=1 Tax=Myriangium duriaei CBS 260.36 TaxID=1168546 RepID=A0A9P4J4I7_9PEZI|nr:hypothetical protein K461DRAFT_319721 [Myriangium duriaei CBS 260.36]
MQYALGCNPLLYDSMAPASSVGSVTEIIDINPGSDGDSSRWPQAGLRREESFEVSYLTKLATKWMIDRGEAIKGQKYVLNKLPNGYGLFGKTRNNDPNHIDRYLYGHPTYKFRSTEEFYEHFKRLMDNGSAVGCTCIGCRGGKRGSASQGTRTPRINGSMGRATSSLPPAQPIPVLVPPILTQQETPLRQVRRWLVPERPPTPEHEMVDDEGCPDIYRRLAERLRTRMVMDDPIKQHNSFDWVIDSKSIGPLMTKIRFQPAFVPRQGELVLFVRGLREHQFISFDQSQQTFAMWDSELESLVELPPWEAGIVTETPDESIEAADLILENPKTYQVNYSGFRIEPMSMVGSNEKHWSKRIAYVRMHAIRPLVFYREILKATKPRDYHPTVQHALTVMSSISLLNPFHFKGLWPAATVFCRGIFVGSELLTIGDVIRLMPGSNQDDTQVWDAIKITSIKMRMIHLDARENPEYDDPTAESITIDRQHDCCIHIDGIAFTRDQARAWGTGKLPIDPGSDILPEVLKDHGRWFRLHDPAKRWKVPFTRVLGRCYERSAVDSWFVTLKFATGHSTVQGFSAINTSQEPNEISIHSMTKALDISKGLKGVMSARIFSTQRDPRIHKADGKAWFWADFRAEQLDLHEVKGQVVTPFLHGKPTRDPRAWKRAMHIREKGAGHKPKPAQEEAAHGIGRGRPSNVGGSMLEASALGPAIDEASDEDAPSDSVAEDANADVVMEDAQNAVVQEEAYIDPNEIMVISDGESSEVESEEED